MTNVDKEQKRGHDAFKFMVKPVPPHRNIQSGHCDERSAGRAVPTDRPRETCSRGLRVTCPVIQRHTVRPAVHDQTVNTTEMEAVIFTLRLI